MSFFDLEATVKDLKNRIQDIISSGISENRNVFTILWRYKPSSGSSKLCEDADILEQKYNYEYEVEYSYS